MPTFDANTLPASTGLNLGSATQRWDAFLQQLNVSDLTTFTGVQTVGTWNNVRVVDGNQFTTIQDAIDDITTSGVVMLPPGQYDISAAITVTDKRIILWGPAGPQATFINNTSSTADAVVFNLAGVASLLRGAGIIGCAITAGGTSNTASAASSGTGVRVTSVDTTLVLDHFAIRNHATLLNITDSFNTQVSNFELRYVQGAAIVLSETGSGLGAGWHFSEGIISNLGATGTVSSSIGIHWINGSGLYVDPTVDITSMNRAVVIIPGAGELAFAGFFNSMLADASTTEGILIDGTNGNIKSIHFNDSWAAFSTNGGGLKVTGANVDGVFWNGGRLRENGTSGAWLDGGTNIHLSNVEVAQNSKSSTNSADGILVGAGVSEWSVIGCRSGNFASGLATTQRWGLNVLAGASDNYRIIGNDFRGNTTGPLSENGTGTVKQILGNIPAVDESLISDQLQLTGGRFINRDPQAFTNADATPSISGGNAFATTGTTAITDFTNGVNGQVIFIRATASITITDSGTLNLSSATNYDMTDGDTLTLIRMASAWHETARSVN